MRVKISEIIVETITRGKSRYQKMAVTYLYNGESRTQNIMSFANPDVFKFMQDVQKGEELEVTLTKNDKGYNEWAKVEKAGAGDTPKKEYTGGKVTGSNYETKEERAARQLLIVRQSSLTNAIAILTHANKEKIKAEDVTDLADELVDYVYGNDEALGDMGTSNGKDEDIPF